ncbi:MAG: ShlB/FhaC/HecB family hemolysin secretion/activation protein [Blastomonas sp.]
MERRTTGKLALGATSAIAMLAVAQPVFAQTVPGAPTREEIQRGLLDQVDPDRARPIAVDGGIERAPCPLANPEFADLAFTLQRVEFANLGVVGADELAFSYSDFVGKQVSVATICEIRDRAATYLREKGYVAAVQVPPQQIDQGVVRLDVLIARIAQVQVRGEAGPSEKLLARYIDKIAAQPAFNIFEAERYLLLARDIPGLDVRLSLRPLEGAPGEVLGEFSVARTPVYADATIQNLGSKQVGRFGGMARLRLNGLTGLGDETTFTAFSTLDFDEQQVLQLAHDMYLGSEGLKLSGDFTYSWSEPSIGAGGNITSETWIAGLEANYPFVRRQETNLTGGIGFEHIDQQVDFGSTPISRDKLSVIYARLGFNQISKASITGRDGYSSAEPNWGIYGNVELRHGLDIFGASEGCGPGLALCALPGAVPPSRAEGDPTAFVLRADARFDYRPSPEVTLTVAPRLQYSPEALFSYEEVSGGNYTIGRGFDPGIIAGDSGFGLRTEFAYGSMIPKDQNSSAFQPFAFLDAMWVWNKDAAFNGLDPQKLYSAGAGLRANIRNGARIEALLAVPLKRAGFQTDRGDVRFLINFTTQLAPWNFD